MSAAADQVSQIWSCRSLKGTRALRYARCTAQIPASSPDCIGISVRHAASQDPALACHDRSSVAQRNPQDSLKAWNGWLGVALSGRLTWMEPDTFEDPKQMTAMTRLLLDANIVAKVCRPWPCHRCDCLLSSLRNLLLQFGKQIHVTASHSLCRLLEAE